MGAAANHLSARLILALAWLAGGLPGCAEGGLPIFRLPFPAGKCWEVIQGNEGAYSHQTEENRFAWDFAMPVGSAVCAAADGRAVGLRGSSRVGGADPSFAREANWILLDHGRGVYSLYYHLDYQGVRVKLGARVAAGQIIGVSGQTGYCAAPHLHFSAMDCAGRSVRSAFAAPGKPSWAPARGDYCRAAAAPGPVLEYSGDSPLPVEIFAPGGVLEFSGLDSVLLEKGRTYSCAGKAEPGAARVRWRVMSPVADEDVEEGWVAAEAGGTFAFKLRFGPWALHWPGNPDQYALTLEAERPSGSGGGQRVGFMLK